MNHANAAAAEAGRRRQGHGKGYRYGNGRIRRCSARGQDITADQRRPGFVRHHPAEEPYDEPDGSAFSFIFLGLERVEGFKRIGGTGGQ